ncbi:MAG: hypothetical protein AAGG08_09325 [Actinomycetota bacterium]
MSDNDPISSDDTPALGTTKRSRTDVYEIIATVLLGVATVAIAWSANQSNLWGGTQDKRLAESVRVANDATDSLQLADSVRQLDQLLFIELLAEVSGPDDDFTPRAEQIVDNMSLEGADAVFAWANGEVEAPFQDEVYLDALFTEGAELEQESNVLYDEGVEANTNGDRYVLASTLMAAVLFFAGISTVLSGIRTRQALLGIATVALVGSIGYMLTLPLA